jgi:nitroreductase
MSLKTILEAGIRAPSGDNCQPWHITAADRRINIYNLPGRDTSLFNSRQRASMIAHGALIENINIASAAVGYKAEIKVFPSEVNPDHVAAVSLEKAPVKEDPLYPCIARRQTNRKSYRAVPLTKEQKETMLSAADDSPSCEMMLFEGKEKDVLCDVAGMSDRIVFENRHLHRFLFNHVRWSEQEARETLDGLDIRTLELSLPDKIGFRLLGHWRAARLLKSLGVTRAVSRQAQKLCSSAAAAGLVLIGNDTNEDFLSAGRVTQRAWLEATRLGLSFQPMTGITFLINRVKAGEMSGLSESHRKLITEAREKISSLPGLEAKTAAMLFRVGTSDPPSARSLRLPLEKTAEFRD